MIALMIGCSPSTIANEKKRGEVSLYRGYATRYKAKAGQAQCEADHLYSRKPYKIIKLSQFTEYVRVLFREDQWSMDAIHGHAVDSQREKWFAQRRCTIM